ncbi:MAG: copper resistance protein CopC [Pseudomonadales bacterium]|nr:copper resistance protein CopC [Pseudomonadales bacterium]MCP5329876.1 copper resistance protein CopC [Pseudomonadales bacterium]MCP5343139.1 copper resistance protein CopC [Pseudomonadales bacterium]
MASFPQPSSLSTTLLLRALLTLVLVLSMAPLAQAQHVMVLNSNSSVELESQPEDDEVLETAPQELMLRFSTYVRLVKLTMKDPEEKLINIGFIYSSDVSRVFFLDLPELPLAPYYTVEWAAIDPENLMARGSFSFSFGPDAAPPSTLIPEEEVLEPVIVPDYRLIDQNF